MATAMNNPFCTMDSLSTMDFGETNSTDIPSVLSAPALHKRRPTKRVRFALTLEPVEEDSIPTSPEVSPTSLSKRTKRLFEPWTQTRPLYGNYIEYLKKQQALKMNETEIDPTPSPVLSSETSPESATYTHTFVIQSKSPTVFIDSITVSTPPIHLPQLVQRGKQPSSKTRSPTVDSYLKQQLTLSNPPRMLHTKKLANATSQRHHYISIQAVPKRTESNASQTSVTHLSNKIARSDSLPGLKPVKEQLSMKKLPEMVMTKSSMNSLSDRSTLPNYLRKPQIPSRLHRSNDELNFNRNYFFQYHDHEQLLRPIIHSSH